MLRLLTPRLLLAVFVVAYIGWWTLAALAIVLCFVNFVFVLWRALFLCGTQLKQKASEAVGFFFSPQLSALLDRVPREAAVSTSSAYDSFSSFISADCQHSGKWYVDADRTIACFLSLNEVGVWTAVGTTAPKYWREELYGRVSADPSLYACHTVEPKL